MTIDYKKCLRCKSKNVLSIVYGDPGSQMLQQSAARKITFGGCCVSDDSPEFQCDDCGHEWTRIQAIDAAYQKIKIIKVSIGGYPGPWYHVEIDLINLKLSWWGKADDDQETPQETVEHKIKKYNRETLLEMLTTLDLLNWKSKYMNYEVRDGTQWGLEIVRDGRTIKKHGQNDYPDNWKYFCKLIRDMTGQGFE